MPKPNDDLFEDSRMSFGEHLEELRSALVKAVISLSVGVLIGLWFAPAVVAFLQKPVENAIRDYRLNKARNEIRQEYGYVSAAQEFQLSNYHMIPKQFRLNPVQLLQLLQNYRPDMFPGEFDELEFTGLHLPLESVPEIAGRLNGARKQQLTADQSVGAGVLFQALSPEQQANINRIAQKEQAGLDDQIQLQQALNGLLEESDWHQAPELDSLYASGDTDWLTSFWNTFWQIEASDSNKAYGALRSAYEQQQDPQLLKRLNRALVEAFVLPDAAVNQFQVLEVWQEVEATTQSLGTTEPFMIFLKAALLVGAIVAGPVIFYFLWNFVAAGLYPTEQQYVYFYMPFSILLFAGGVTIAFVFAFEPVLRFLFSFNQMMGIDPQPQIGQWLSFVLTMPLGFGIAFQLPLAMLLLNRIGMLSLETYISQWKVAVMVIAFLSMILTPADPISMMLLGVPLLALYGLGIALCYFLPANRRPFPEGYDPA